jgi:hypothetical protein
MQRVKEIYRKIVEAFKKEPLFRWVALGVGIVLIIILINIILLFSKKNEVDFLVEVPLGYQTGPQIKISRDISENLDFDPKMKVFKYESIQATKLPLIINNLGLNYDSQKLLEQGLKSWEKGKSRAIFNDATETISFELEDPLTTSESKFLTRKNADDFINSLLKTLGFPNEYRVIDYEELPSEVRIKFSIVTPTEEVIERGGDDEFTDSLILTREGAIKSGRLTTIQVIELEEADFVSIIHPTQIQSLSSYQDFPKEISQRLPLSNDIEYLLEDTDESYVLTPIAKTYETNKMEIIYLFDPLKSVYITPVYKLLSEGEITYNGEEYIVPALIYLNAIDPKSVYIPADPYYLDLL